VICGIGWDPGVQRVFWVKRGWLILRRGQSGESFQELDMVLGVEEAVDFIVNRLVASSSAFPNCGSTLCQNEECFWR
jgi:hypothetical protein